MAMCAGGFKTSYPPDQGPDKRWPWKTSQRQPQRVPFFIYEDPVYRPKLCHNPMFGDSYTFFYHDFLEQAFVHPWRVKNPLHADVFVVPFDVDRSFDAALSPRPELRRDAGGHALCEGVSHKERIAAAIAKLRASRFFKRKGGADHYWGMGSWRIREFSNLRDAYFPYKDYDVLSKMMVGHFMNMRVREPLPPARDPKLPRPTRFHWFDYFKDHWGCSIVMPVTVASELWVPDETYEEWKARPTSIFYRGKSRDCHDMVAAAARNRTLEVADRIPDAIISRGHAPDYPREIRGSRFCLVLGCDNPQTSRFFDAMAAGCIPVTINNGYRLVVAPFSRLINYDSFSIDIQETIVLEDPYLAMRYVLEEHEAAVKDLHRALMAERSKLLWSHPYSDVASWAFRQMKTQLARTLVSAAAEVTATAANGDGANGGDGSGCDCKRERIRAFLRDENICFVWIGAAVSEGGTVQLNRLWECFHVPLGRMEGKGGNMRREGLPEDT
ncbi:unnamed protein product [Phaeothamnion confervicola]